MSSVESIGSMALYTTTGMATGACLGASMVYGRNPPE